MNFFKHLKPKNEKIQVNLGIKELKKRLIQEERIFILNGYLKIVL
jgi:hypothetical protein